MGYLRLVLAVLLMATFPSVYGGDCFKDKDVDDCRVRAEQGDALAQTKLGMMYDYGEGVRQDQKEAVKWYRKATEQGSDANEGAYAATLLGLIYATGKGGVLQDYKEAVKWYRKAAEQGVSLAQVKLGILYATGQGVPQDQKEALKLYRMSAEQGESQALALVGVMYYEGLGGVLQDYKEAVKWYRKAAEQGSIAAQFNLGLMYAKGQGVIKDNVMTHMYWNIAAAGGDKKAKKGRGMVETQMTPSQIEKAQDLAREWMRTHQ